MNLFPAADDVSFMIFGMPLVEGRDSKQKHAETWKDRWKVISESIMEILSDLSFGLFIVFSRTLDLPYENTAKEREDVGRSGPPQREEKQKVEERRHVYRSSFLSFIFDERYVCFLSFIQSFLGFHSFGNSWIHFPWWLCFLGDVDSQHANENWNEKKLYGCPNISNKKTQSLKVESTMKDWRCEWKSIVDFNPQDSIFLDSLNFSLRLLSAQGPCVIWRSPDLSNRRSTNDSRRSDLHDLHLFLSCPTRFFSIMLFLLVWDRKGLEMIWMKGSLSWHVVPWIESEPCERRKALWTTGLETLIAPWDTPIVHKVQRLVFHGCALDLVDER